MASALGPVPTSAYSPRGAAFHAVTEPLMSHLTPRLQQLNRATGNAWDAAPNALPWDTAGTASRGAAPLTTQILLDLLRGAL